MYTVLEKKELSPGIKLMVIEAPMVANKANPGEFIILKVDEFGERIPLTIADFDRTAGTVTIIFQEVGASTRLLGKLEPGNTIADFVGPLGKPTHIKHFGTVVCIGGGIGVAPVYPIARGMFFARNKVISVIGARTREMVILEDEMRAVSTSLVTMTDDGSRGQKGFVTHALTDIIKSGEKIDLVVAIGPVAMMKAVAETTKPFGIKTVVSLNPIMVDGTGMCGGCRVAVGTSTKFACVDGPEFDAHDVDFNGLMVRQRMYDAKEKQANDHAVGNFTLQTGDQCQCQCQR